MEHISSISIDDTCPEAMPRMQPSYQLHSSN